MIKIIKSKETEIYNITLGLIEGYKPEDNIARLPHGALERLYIVKDDTERLALTTAKVQNGDTVKVTKTGLMYFVVDDTKLSSDDGYEICTTGSATKVPFGNIVNKSNPEDKKSNLEQKDIIERIFKRLDETEDKTGIYLSLKITESNILYKREWGCPPLGEPVLDISITRNPKFNTDDEKFKYAVKTLTQLLKEEFKQSTVTMTVSSGIIYYYD